MGPKNPDDMALTIVSPAVGDVLASNFSVFGTCGMISPTSSPTITVTLKDNQGNVVASVNAVLNNGNGTWEAVFSGVSVSPGLQPLAIEVSCSGMQGISSVGQLTSSVSR
jgi:hypothetical protein